MTRYYDSWIEEQSGKVELAMRVHSRRGTGHYDMAVYVVPSNGATAGKLVLAEEKPSGATDVVRFPAQGTRVMCVPYSHLSSLLWHACRSFPILPTEGPDAA